jgi:hypothetical protein
VEAAEAAVGVVAVAAEDSRAYPISGIHRQVVSPFRTLINDRLLRQVRAIARCRDSATILAINF